ncbi:MAG TPA: vanadium-dependent haloperoxidase [Blastocatellia bacterium]|nr:vanadium-dependent haloperoxidase [Blastocatellia bacterium]
MQNQEPKRAVETGSQRQAPSSPSRREFLGSVGGAAAVTIAAGAIGVEPLLGSKSSEARAIEIAPQGGIQRRDSAYQVRHQAAIDEKNLGAFSQPTNGDEEAYPNRIGNFHKTLPHNSIGEVDSAAYNALLNALSTGDFNDFENVPKGGTGEYANPMGGLAFNMEGPDSPATTLVSVPFAIASPERAAEMAELYWEAYLRDVPFADYNTNPEVQEACDDLSAMQGYRGPRHPMSNNVTPQLLFRYDFPGALDGPMVSQILYRTFTYDGITVVPQMRARQPVINWSADGTFTFDSLGRDFLTAFSEWLNAQNGVGVGNVSVFDGNRFIRSVRDLGHHAGSDTIVTSYTRAALVLGGLGAVVDDGNPYKNSNRQGGFATFGAGHLHTLIGSAFKGERHAWYQKWNVHRHLRPEAYGGLVDNHLQGRATYPIPSDLLGSSVLTRIAAYNQHLNQVRFGSNEASYLLAQELPGGSPSHPSAPAGHAITAGACVTILKAWFKEDTVLSNAVTVKPNRDGTALLPYVAGVDGPPLTIGGELNKLAHNLSEGRNMSGVHWRVSDNITGLFQGEEVAIRLLREATATYPEPNAHFSLTKFDGTTITI